MLIMCWEEVFYEILVWKSNLSQIKTSTFCEFNFLKKDISIYWKRIMEHYKYSIFFIKFNCLIGPNVLEVGPLPSKKEIFFICFNDSPSKMMNNAFYIILKALFVLKIFKFLSWLFGHVEKTTWWERLG